MHRSDISPVHSYLPFNITRYEAGDEQSLRDQVVVEEPLEIRVGADVAPGQPWIVTMRTPGNDKELVTGHLYTEGLINQASDVLTIRNCGLNGDAQHSNTIFVKLSSQILAQIENSKRSQRMNSSCGLCGKDSLSSLVKREFRNTRAPLANMQRVFDALQSFALVESVYQVTGGCHACAWINDQGEIIYFFEDVGRHNALDKLIGQSLIEKRSDLNSGALILSGRVSYEMIDKAARAKVSTVIAVGAPSSLAIDLAKHYNINLLGFGKSQSINTYHHVNWCLHGPI